jgi:NAD-dependent SIR2 family protein deacetylase
LERQQVPSADAPKTVADVARNLRSAHSRDVKCTVLMGAGCSVSGNIPDADGFVGEVASEYPDEYEKAAATARKRDPGNETPSYFDCMEELTQEHRLRLLARHIEDLDDAKGARVNWANLCVAWLMHEGYVDRVLTTNFDSLLERACAWLRVAPAIYDLSLAHDAFRPERIPDRAILHLHGRYHGFMQVMTLAQMQNTGDYSA